MADEFYRHIQPPPVSRRITSAAQISASSPKPESKVHGMEPSPDQPYIPGKEVILYHQKAEHPSFIKPPSSRVEQRHLEFLRSEGALSLPDRQSQQAMVEAFAVFSYPYLPIVDLKKLLDPLQDYGHLTTAPCIGLLLYQAILYAGSAFVDAHYFQGKDGALASRRATRAELSRRVTVSRLCPRL